MMPLLNDFGAAIVESNKEISKNMISINGLHQILVHCGKAGARLTEKALG
jgi:hypothetical protein